MSGEHTHGKDPECLGVFEKLSEYIDGEMSPVDCAHLEHHMADCPPCVDFLKSLRASVAAAHEFDAPEPPPPVPPQFEDRLKAAWSEALARRGQAPGE